MKNIYFISLFCALSFSICSAQAAIVRPMESNGSAWGKTHFLTALVDMWKYEEFPDIMKDSGALPGFGYAFKHNFDMFYFEANVEAEYGPTTYEGHTMQNNADISFTQTNFIYMGQVWGGLQIHVAGPVHIIPKVGYLYRKLVDFDDDVGGDYRREQLYYAIPVGVDVIVRLPVGQLGITAWTTADFRGQNQTFLSNVGGDRDPRFKQDEGSGYHIEASYMYDMFILGGFVRYWKVENSNLQYAVLPGPGGADFYLEPQNETISFGIKGGVTF